MPFVAIYIALFLSGASSLIFEGLWFKQAALSFGSTVWATSWVLAGFMAGMAIGSLLMITISKRLNRPLILYATLELTIAVTGTSLTKILPYLNGWIAYILPSFHSYNSQTHVITFISSFIILLLPSIAMGATLPVVVQAIGNHGPEHGRTIGSLYGINTLGAVLGAVAGDLLFVKYLGIQNSSFCAALIGCSAGLLPLINQHLTPRTAGAADNPSEIGEGSQAKRLVPLVPLFAAAFLAGGALLGLEVIWFRFVILFFPSYSFIFCLMLAVVLAGIGSGSFAASIYLKGRVLAIRFLPLISLTAGILIPLSYHLFNTVLLWISGHQVAGVFGLMFPISFLSGVIFTFIAQSIQMLVGNSNRSASLLVAWNTFGSMVGSLVAGLLLIPRFGIEKGFFTIAIIYGLIAVCLSANTKVPRLRYPVALLFCAAYLGSLISFPFGTMSDRALQFTRQRVNVGKTDYELVVAKEGLNETLQLVRHKFLGEPLQYQLITNDHSMTSTSLVSRRYMKLFAYLLLP